MSNKEVSGYSTRSGLLEKKNSKIGLHISPLWYHDFVMLFA